MRGPEFNEVRIPIGPAGKMTIRLPGGIGDLTSFVPPIIRVNKDEREAIDVRNRYSAKP